MLHVNKNLPIILSIHWSQKYEMALILKFWQSKQCINNYKKNNFKSNPKNPSIHHWPKTFPLFNAKFQNSKIESSKIHISSLLGPILINTTFKCDGNQLEKNFQNLETTVKKHLELMQMVNAWFEIHLHKTTFPLKWSFNISSMSKPQSSLTCLLCSLVTWNWTTVNNCNNMFTIHNQHKFM